MNINMDTSWANFSSTTSGSGSESVSNGVLTANSDIGEQGYRTCDYALAEGETYIFSCEARVLTNNGSDPNPGMFLDYPTFPNTENSLFFDSEYWKYYELKFTVFADHVKSTDFVTFGAGSWLLTDGSCEIRNPRLRTETINPMSSSIWAYAWVEISDSGVVTILEQNNVVSAVWQSGGGSADSDLLMTVPGIPSGLNVAPRPKAIGTTTGPDQYIPKTASTITGGSNGQFNVKILDTSLSTYIQSDPDSTTRIYVEVSY